jgi:hypothetical protein
MPELIIPAFFVSLLAPTYEHRPGLEIRRFHLFMGCQNLGVPKGANGHLHHFRSLIHPKVHSVNPTSC